jgi:segregation and condensation protein B
MAASMPVPPVGPFSDIEPDDHGSLDVDVDVDVGVGVDVGDGNAAAVSVAEAARLLGRDRTRVYALIRSGDLVAVPSPTDVTGPLRVDRASLERWLVAGGAQGRPLSPRNAWALIALASGDQTFSERCLGLLERPEDISRTRARLGKLGMLQLAPRLHRRAVALVLRLSARLVAELEHDASLVRTGLSAARPYGWPAPDPRAAWRLEAYVAVDAVVDLERRAADAVEAVGEEAGTAVLLRVIDGPWPFPPNYELAPQPLAALDLLEYPDPATQHIGREVLRGLRDVAPATVARRTARARAVAVPRSTKLLAAGMSRVAQTRLEGDPRTDTAAAAAHVLGVLWATNRQGATVKELRAAIGITRERLEAAYEYLQNYPLLGLAVQRHGDELRLVSSGQVATSVGRHLNAPRPVALSTAAQQVLAIVAYRQPVSQAGIESLRGTSSDSALDTLLQRQLIALDGHRLFTTTRTFLEYFGLRDLADLPPLASLSVGPG